MVKGLTVIKIKMKIMKYLNKIATSACFAALGMLMLTGCEGAELYSIGSPDWISEKVDSIRNANQGGGEEELVGMEEDVYTVGATDFSTGWWQQFSKYYQIPENEKWNVVFNLSINPNATNTYKNFALIISNDEDRGATNYKEYGAIRFDHQPSGNSEWGDEYINLHRDWVESNLTFGSDTDKGVDKLGGRVVLTIDRSKVDTFFVKITNGTVTKTFLAPEKLPNLNADASNTTIRAFLVPEGSYINFLESNVEPIGGFTSAEDKNPLSMTFNGLPNKVLVGTSFEDAIANMTATIQFEQEVAKDVPASDLQIELLTDISQLGTQKFIAIYNKTYKGENCDKPILAYGTFEVVPPSSFVTIGAIDNSGDFWSAHSENIKVEAGETFVTTFTNYTNGAANWNNFCVVLTSDGTDEYAVVRADNYGWGKGYENNPNLVTSGGQTDWAAWLKAMDGAKVTTYVTNNGNGTADVKAVMVGNDNITYEQYYNGIIISNDLYFRFTVDHSHLEFDTMIGAEDNSTAFWGAHSADFNVPVGKTVSTRFKNFTSGLKNWNNFCVVLTSDRTDEYAVVRADNYGWGKCYENNPNLVTSGGQTDWAAWLKAMDEAMVTVSVTNNGGSVDVKCVMVGNDGNTYTQSYSGIAPTDGDNVFFRMTVDGSHLVFE
jgi:hypothetical protein